MRTLPDEEVKVDGGAGQHKEQFNYDTLEGTNPPIVWIS
jgi:hypothetical protein